MCADAHGAIWVCSFNTGEVLRVIEGAQITHRLKFPGSAVACTLGGEDGRTLFITTYDGSIPDQHARKRLGAIHTVRVDVPAP
ncbi:SMP-30/Gluconolaconase/LRE-like region [compost metagenome]